MTSTRNKQYSDNQYNRTPDHELGSGFSNYERLMVELNNRLKAYWIEKDTFETSDIVIAGNPEVSYTYKIIGKPELTCGM